MRNAPTAMISCAAHNFKRNRIKVGIVIESSGPRGDSGASSPRSSRCSDVSAICDLLTEVGADCNTEFPQRKSQIMTAWDFPRGRSMVEPVGKRVVVVRVRLGKPARPKHASDQKMPSDAVRCRQPSDGTARDRK